MATLVTLWVWVKAHPYGTVQGLLLLWAVANVIWSQWPKPHSERGMKIWKALHSIFLLIATHSSAAGTFTWPFLLRTLVTTFLGIQSKDPFGPSEPVEPMPPTLPAAGEPTAAPTHKTDPSPAPESEQTMESAK